MPDLNTYIRALKMETDTEGELANRIAELQNRLASLVKEKMNEDEEREPECALWNKYEEFISEDPLAFIFYGNDSLATLEVIKKKNMKELEGITRFFRGETFVEKKRRLLTFLRRAPSYRTNNLKLLEQRLFITRRWMKENNLAHIALEDLPLIKK